MKSLPSRSTTNSDLFARLDRQTDPIQSLDVALAPIRSREVLNHNLSLIRPRSRRLLVLARQVLLASFLGELLDARDSADGRLNGRPELNQHVQRLAQRDELHKRHACQTHRHRPAQVHGEADDEQRQRRRRQVEREDEPALHHDEQVKGPLRAVHEGVVALDGGAAPAERAERREAREGLEELRVHGGLFLEVEQAELARGAQVAAL